MTSLRIVRLANFVTPQSGGLRTALAELGAGYLAAGHEPVLIVPGEHATDRQTAQGRVLTVPASTVPGAGGYRVITRTRSVRRILETLGPDRVEVSDRTTLRWVGPWAEANGVQSMMVSHESLDGLLRMFAPSAALARTLADRMNRTTANAFDTVVCTTSWSADEFRRVDTPNLRHIPLGVDLHHFRPDRRDDGLQQWLAPNGELLLLHCGRLSPEKRPDLSIATLAELRRRKVPAVLVIAGDGPRRKALERMAGRLLVRFLGFMSDRDELARLLATADVVLAPGPIETFGLAALEALASGTPAVVNSQSALPEVVDAGGLAADGTDVAFADAVEDLAARPVDIRRRAARQRAEMFGWPNAVQGFLDAHAAATTSPSPSIAATGRRTYRTT